MSRNSGLKNLNNRMRRSFSEDEPIYKPTTIENKKPDPNYILGKNIDISIQSNRLSKDAQQDRMILGERESFEKALFYSYHATNIKRIDSDKITRALINKSADKENYNDKTIAVAYEYGVKPGSIIEWLFNDTKWLVYLQDYGKKGYFRGTMRKCDYEINWEDENKEKHTTYCAVIGPQESNISSSTVHKFILDEPNYSLQMLIPNNEDTIKYFKRYAKFYIKGIDTCWRVEAVNNINIPGIIKVNANEYYINKDLDDVENGIVDGNKEEVVQTPDLSRILGTNTIKPKIEYEYSVIYLGESNWSVDEKYPVSIKIDSNDSKKIKLKWTRSYSGTFELKYGNISKTIVVESLF